MSGREEGKVALNEWWFARIVMCVQIGGGVV